MYQLRMLSIGLLFAFFSQYLIGPGMFNNPVGSDGENNSTRMSATKPIDEKLGGGVKTHIVDGDRVIDLDYGPGGH